MRSIVIHAGGVEAKVAAHEVARGFGKGADIIEANKVEQESLRRYDAIVICTSVGFLGISGDINKLMYRIIDYKIPGKFGAVVGIQKYFGFMAKNKLSRLRYGLENMGIKIVSEVLIKQGGNKQGNVLNMLGKKLKSSLRTRSSYGLNVDSGIVKSSMVIGFSEIEKMFDEFFSRLFGKPKEVKMSKFKEHEYEPEIIERKKDITVLMELKGVSEADLNINLENQDLVVRMGDAVKRVVLPMAVKKFEYTFKNGVLEVILQKT